MKTMLAVCMLAALAGCAEYPQQGSYAQGGYAQPRDPSQWRVVSVTPVPLGTGDQVAARSPDGSRVEYSSQPITVTQPVYLAQPVYVPQPIYVQEPAYYYPPVSLSLGFVFGNHWSRGGRFRGRHR